MSKIIVNQIESSDGTTDVLNTLSAVSIAGDSTIMKTVTGEVTSTVTLTNSTSWTDHITLNFTTTRVGPVICTMNFGSGYESNLVYGEGRFLLDDTTATSVFMGGVQTTSNRAVGGSGTRVFSDVSAGSHTIKVQIRNNGSSSTWKTPYYGDATNHATVQYY